MNNFAGYDYWVVENVKKDYFYPIKVLEMNFNGVGKYTKAVVVRLKNKIVYLCIL